MFICTDFIFTTNNINIIFFLYYYKLDQLHMRARTSIAFLHWGWNKEHLQFHSLTAFEPFCLTLVITKMVAMQRTNKIQFYLKWKSNNVNFRYRSREHKDQKRQKEHIDPIEKNSCSWDLLKEWGSAFLQDSPLMFCYNYAFQKKEEK